MAGELPRQLLPQSLLELAEYCGDAVMWAVWQHWGGGHLRVPRSLPGPDHVLVQVLGVVAAARLCEAFGGEMLMIPKAEAARRAVRDGLIRQGRAEGLDNFTLARQFNLTERQISTICRGDGGVGLNMDLWE